ncbi:uncharacterized protein LOC116628153 [Phoca vitulina]|uniref:uncharacterized protein LOC116628153 n=1 Tax=Phoca vitulina TaxID=9720 RepID=UPI0013965E2D|nr:uncharacterized protein LOC116628153 [Phoca vitulina]
MPPNSVRKRLPVGFCAREFGSQETKEAWRAPGAEDPSFNTFAVPLTPIHSFADDLGYQGSQELTSTRSPCVAGWVGESTLSSLSDSPGKKTPASPRPGGGSGARGRTRCRRRTRPAGPRARAVPEAGAEAVPGLAGARAAAEGAPQRPGEQRQHARVPGRGFAPQPGRLPPMFLVSDNLDSSEEYADGLRSFQALQAQLSPLAMFSPGQKPRV